MPHKETLTKCLKFFCDRGFLLFPCRSRNEGQFRVKSPLCRWLDKGVATADYEALLKDTEKTSTFGLRTGMEIPGMPGKYLYIIDADKGIDKKTGKLYDGDRYLKTHFPEASETFVSLTPNGRHYWFYTDKPLNGRVRFAPGLDTRGWHNYICMPGSHCQNGDYVIDLEKFHIDPLPPRILDAVLAAIPQEQPHSAPQEEQPRPQKNPPTPKHVETPTETVQTFFSERSLRAAARKVQNSEEGERHSVLFRQAVYVGTCIPRYIQEDDAFDMLYKAAKAAGLEHDEIVRTISDGFRSNVAMTRKHVFDDDPDVPGRNRMRGIFGDTVEEDDEPFSMPHL